MNRNLPNEQDQIELNVVTMLRAKNFMIINKDLLNIYGLNVTVFLSDIIDKHQYFKTKFQITDGWFYNTENERERTTKLSPHIQKQCIKILIQDNILEVERRGIPAKQFFKINYENINNKLLKYQQQVLKILRTDDQNFKDSSLKNKELYNKTIYNKTIIIKSNNKIHSQFERNSSQEIKKEILHNKCRKLFDHWNRQEVITHRTPSKFFPIIKSKLKEGYTYTELKEAISNYAEVLRNDRYYFSYRWSLYDFLSRKNGLDKFLTKNLPFQTFKKFQSNNSNNTTKDSYPEVTKKYCKYTSTPENKKHLLIKHLQEIADFRLWLPKEDKTHFAFGLDYHCPDAESFLLHYLEYLKKQSWIENPTLSLVSLEGTVFRNYLNEHWQQYEGPTGFSKDLSKYLNEYIKDQREGK